MSDDIQAGKGHRPLATKSVDFTMMYVAHAAFTRDLRRLSRENERGQARTPVARAQWAMFTKQLHIHHRAEDTALWPLLRAAALRPDESDVIDQMEREHAQIDPQLERIDVAFASDDGALLGEEIQALASTLTAHMRHEEDAALPLVEAHLGAAGWAKFGAAIRQTQGLRGAAEYLPWLLDDVSTEVQAKVLKMLPPPVRFLYRRSWAPAYRRRVPQ